MEFALWPERFRDGKPRELMTPSNHEGVFDANGRRYRTAWADGIWEIKPFAKILRLSMDLPIVIEIVDSDERVNAFLPVLDEMMGDGLVTLQRVKVVRHRSQGRI
jgi:Uncharacterized ACR, COG1993